jgi:hypothetical protein
MSTAAPRPRYISKNFDEPTRRELLEDKLRAVRRQWGTPQATIEELPNRQWLSALSLPTCDEFAALEAPGVSLRLTLGLR